MTDYKNDRWHVDGAIVRHDDFPGYAQAFTNEALTSEWAAGAGGNPREHFARAWLAAQPKPTIEVGMRIEATLRGGAVVTGEVATVTDCGNWTTVYVGPGVVCYADARVGPKDARDITAWHEVTA